MAARERTPEHGLAQAVMAASTASSRKTGSVSTSSTFRPSAGMERSGGRKCRSSQAHCRAKEPRKRFSSPPLDSPWIEPCGNRTVEASRVEPSANCHRSGARGAIAGDVFKTRKGLRIEIGNTDAEGRVILCDAPACAAEGKPALIIDLAALNGAARVALGRPRGRADVHGLPVRPFVWMQFASVAPPSAARLSDPRASRRRSGAREPRSPSSARYDTRCHWNSHTSHPV